MLPDAAGRAGEREPLTTCHFTAVQPQIRRVPTGARKAGLLDGIRRHLTRYVVQLVGVRGLGTARARLVPRPLDETAAGTLHQTTWGPPGLVRGGSPPACAGRTSRTLSGGHRGGGHGRPELLDPVLTEMGALRHSWICAGLTPSEGLMTCGKRL
ncbi:hypothetical protein [Streptomyces sp. AK02-04a]|uniref:hypothetical protein n=1 Tax=Streptomyces sp. AK02-04a TaxID=3028649 RepID=UPI0029B2A396|nr:hypothetical protein [Streptomyces sp. AK02-04a]MDX3759829.1 hypothetical protein [Streptomyces sp. AK02-04a]